MPLNVDQSTNASKPSTESTICRLSRILTIALSEVDYRRLCFSRDRRGAPPGSILRINYFTLEVLP
jgi:hypothetical protein